MTKTKLIRIAFVVLFSLSILYIPLANSQEWTPSGPVKVYECELDQNSTHYNYAIDWSPDGKYIAFISELESKLIILSVDDGSIVYSKNYVMSPGFAVKFSPDGKYLAVGVFGAVEILDTAKWAVLNEDTAYYLSSISWSPDSRYIAYSNDSSIKIIDVKNFNIYHHFACNEPEAKLDWSPNGVYLAYASTESTNNSYAELMNIIDTHSWSRIRVLKLYDFTTVKIVKWSPNSMHLLVGGDVLNRGYGWKGLIQVWNITKWESEELIDFGNETIPFSVAWNPTKPLVALGLNANYFKENAFPKLIIINTENWTIDQELEPMTAIELHSEPKSMGLYYYSVAWSPDGNSLAAGYKDVVVYTTEKGLFGGGTTENQNLLSQPLLWAAIGIIVLAVAVSVWYWKKKAGKKENMETEEVNPDRENERP